MTKIAIQSYQMKKNLSILYTNKCPIECRHCSVDAGPLRDTKLSPENILPHLSEFHDFGIREIRFTGGEPLLFIDELKEIAGECRQIGWSQVVFSNGFWASTIDSANQYALQLREMGIGKVVLSTSIFHAEYVPLKNIRTAVDALKSAGVQTSILVMRHHEKTPEYYSIVLNVKLTGVYYEYYKFVPEGRGKRLSNEKIYKEETKHVLNTPCPLQAQTHINFNGDVFPCCTVSQTPLETKDFFHLGNILKDKTEDILKKKQHKIFNVLASEGPGGIYRQVESELKAGGFKLSENYYGVCMLCKELLGSKNNLDIIVRCYRK